MDDPISQHPMRSFVAMLLGQYPHSAPDNPTIYRLSMAEIFAAYPETAVRACVNPVRGLATEPTDKFGLPELRDVKAWLERWSAAEATRARYAAMKPAPRVAIGYVRSAPVAQPNLFVPDTSPRYAGLLKLHEESGGKQSHFETRVCSDGATRAGMWMPMNWFYEMPAAIKQIADAVAKPKRKAS